MWIYSLILICAFALDLAILLVQHERRPRFQLNAGLVLVASFYAYTGALPFSRLVLGTEPSTHNVEQDFMFCNLLAALGLTLGLVTCRQFVGIAKSHQDVWRVAATEARGTLRGELMLMTVAFSVGAACYYFLSHASFSFDTLAGAYGADNSITNDNVTVIDTLLVPLAICAVLHYLYAVKVRALRGPSILAMNAICFVFFAMFLIQGHRNLMIYMGLPVLGLKYYGRPIRLATFAAAATLSIVGFYTIGIVRNWGWTQLDQVVVNEQAFDPLHGELGAPFSVYDKMQEGLPEDSLLLGRTYSIDAVVNLVPQQLWRNRPPSPAVRFAQTYYNTDNLTSGLGFSPLVESIVNFSSYGVPVVFALTAFIFVRLDRWARSRNRLGVLISCVLLPTIVNWNRIDFAACGKTFLVYCAFLWGLDKLFYRPVMATGPLPRMNRVASLPLGYVRTVTGKDDSTNTGFSPSASPPQSLADA